MLYWIYKVELNITMKPTKELKEQWHKDPNNWKFGLFYYNKDDKRLLPPKRYKFMGWTVNFANPASVLILVLLLVAIITIALYI